MNSWISYLEEHAKNQPDKEAFRMAGAEGISYGDLYKKLLINARQLRDFFGGETPREPVAVAVDRDLPSLIRMLSVLAAGAWYVPVDAALPEARIRALLEVCQPAAYIPEEGADVDFGIPMLELKGEGQPLETYVPRDELEPMFGIFTSGSTGLPKLVVKDARGIHEFIREYCSCFSLTGEDRFGNQIPFYFDASTKDLFSTIYLGATSVILPQKVFSFPVDLVDTLNSERINSLVCVPSVMSSVAVYETFSERLPEYLKNVLFVGEKMPIRVLNYWMDALKDVNFVNLYGSTEVAGNSCYYRVTGRYSEDQILPIGRAFATSMVLLLDEKGQEAKEGEICVMGHGLALGYYRDDQKTKEVFRRDEATGELIYHSGDYGRLNSEGLLVCVSRNDAQIKHMGHRVELGDIEACVSGFPYIAECCCLFSKQAEQLILFFSCKEGDDKQVKRDLRKKLPKYMLPENYIAMEALPHNRNGKIDRAGLLKDWEGQRTNE